jgi:hypothetical protein
MRAWGSAAAVIAALRDDAAAERERLERESASVLEALSADVAPRTPECDDAAGSDRVDVVRRANAEADAGEDWEDVVAAAADRDAWISAVAEAGRRAIAAAPDAQGFLARLTREAVFELPGDEAIVALPSALVADAEAWRGAIERDTRKRLAFEAAPFAAGCIARTPDGRVTFDNTVEARERRSRTEWRTAIARLYEEVRDRVPAEAT